MTARAMPLERFFVVTNTAIHLVEFGAGAPSVTKIMIRGARTSNIPVGTTFAGDIVVLTTLALFTCSRKNGKYCMLGNTAPPVGLFFEEVDALRYASTDRHAKTEEDRCMQEARMIKDGILALRNPRLLIRDALSFICDEIYMPEG